MFMAECQPGIITRFFADLDATSLQPRSDFFHPDDLAARQSLPEHGIIPVDVTARPASRMDKVWEQTGGGDSIIGGGTTFYLDGVEAEELRIWLEPGQTAAMIDRFTRVNRVTKTVLAKFVGYNGLPMTPVHNDLLRDQPAQASPMVCFTMETRRQNDEIIQEILAGLGLQGLFVELSPYHGSSEVQYAHISLANKEIGMRVYQKERRVSVMESAGVGDSGPDRGIFARTALRYAMGNSTRELRQSGFPHRLVRSVGEQGLSEAIELTIEHNRSLRQG